MVAILNGRLDVATLAAVPGGLLRADAADAWVRVRAAAGLDLRPTSWADTYRSYAVQERIFRERYTTSWVTGIDPRRWLGQTWWRLPGNASAAVPGTSNHGWGVAIDVTGLGGFGGSAYARLAAVAPAHGWSNRSGRQIDEAWHWEYSPDADIHPTPAQEDDMPLDAKDATLINNVVISVLRSTEAKGIIRDAVLTAVLDDGVGTLSQAVRDTRVIARRTEVAVLSTPTPSTPSVATIDYAALAAALVAHIKP